MSRISFKEKRREQQQECLAVLPVNAPPVSLPVLAVTCERRSLIGPQHSINMIRHWPMTHMS